jgi:CBS domain containing-hemolysin-like protein
MNPHHVVGEAASFVGVAIAVFCIITRLAQANQWAARASTTMPVCLLRTQALFRRAQLKALVDVHSSAAGFGGTLSEQEIAVIRGALDLTNKTAAKSMTPLDKVMQSGVTAI